MSAEIPKSARRGGGVVKRAGQGANPLPPSLWISAKKKTCKNQHKKFTVNYWYTTYLNYTIQSWLLQCNVTRMASVIIDKPISTPGTNVYLLSGK